jgi:RNA polymerase sigma-70 factor (ECF subfamily)
MPQLQPESRAPAGFPTTHWSRVTTAAGRDNKEAQEALAILCQAYWYPIYAFVRYRGFSPEQAQDLTQDFFAYLLERDLIARADPSRGRFRAFLRTVCARHLTGDRDRENAAKRGGGRLRLAIDPIDAERRYVLEPAHEMTAERIFDRTWAMTLLGRVVDRLRGEYDDAGRSSRFEELITVLTRDPESDPYAEIARRLGTTEGSIRVAVHRLRRRYGLLLREEIAATVGDIAQVDDEIQALFASLAV